MRPMIKKTVMVNPEINTEKRITVFWYRMYVRVTDNKAFGSLHVR